MPVNTAIIYVKKAMQNLKQKEDNYITIPKEPTEEMLDAICAIKGESPRAVYREVYITMTNAYHDNIS